MPGPVSDSYDPEFGTGENADMVRTRSSACATSSRNRWPKDLKNIVELAYHGPGGKLHGIRLSENELRVVRFALNRALESI